MPWPPSKDPADYSEPGRWEGGGAPIWLRALGRLLRYKPDTPRRYVASAVLIGLVAGVAVALITGVLQQAIAIVVVSRLAVDVWWSWHKRRRQRLAG